MKRPLDSLVLHFPHDGDSRGTTTGDGAKPHQRGGGQQPRQD